MSSLCLFCYEWYHLQPGVKFVSSLKSCGQMRWATLTSIISNPVKGKFRKALFTEFLPQHERDVRVISLFSKPDHQKVASLFIFFVAILTDHVSALQAWKRGSLCIFLLKYRIAIFFVTNCKWPTNSCFNIWGSRRRSTARDWTRAVNTISLNRSTTNSHWFEFCE